MMTRTKIVIATISFAVLVLAVTLLSQKSQTVASVPVSSVAPEAEVWTCSMHPQVRLPKPGNCPICSMPLIRVGGDTKSSATNEPMLQLSEHARAMASVETVAVERREVSHELRAVGKVQYNETALATVKTTLSRGDLAGLRIQLVADAGAAMLVLLVATTLSIYKPRGLTPYGWRKQREEHAASQS